MSKDKPNQLKKNATTVSTPQSQYHNYEEYRLSIRAELGRELNQDELYQCFIMSVVKKSLDGNTNNEIDVLGKMPYFDHGPDGSDGTSA